MGHSGLGQGSVRICWDATALSLAIPAEPVDDLHSGVGDVCEHRLDNGSSAGYVRLNL